MLNRMISVKKQYLKLFNCVPELNYWYYIAICETIWLYANEWIEFNWIISVKLQYL